LLDTSENTYESSRFGAIWFNREYESIATSESGNNSVNVSDTVLGTCNLISGIGLINYTSSAECPRLTGISYLVQYNFTALHSGPLYQTLADQAIVRYATKNPNIIIETTIAPLPITRVEAGYGAAEDVFLSWFLVRH
jgi:hypothetical protein